MNTPVKTALIGYGYAGKTIHAPLIKAAKGLELYAIISSRPDEVAVVYPTVKTLTFAEARADPEIELVVIATPNELHAPQAHAALSAGKHVVIDKPFALNASEAEGLIYQARSANRLLSVFHSRRFDHDFLTLKSLIEEDRIGDIRHLTSRYERWRPEVRDRWRERDGPGAGLWYDLGPHLLDQALVLMGRPQWIRADITKLRPGALTDDYFHVVLGYERARVILQAGMLTTLPSKPFGLPRFEVQGDKGCFISYGMDSQEEALKRGRRPGAKGWGKPSEPLAFIPAGETTPEVLEAVRGDYRQYYESTARAIRNGVEPPIPVHQALMVMQLLDEARLSVEALKARNPTTTSQP